MNVDRVVDRLSRQAFLCHKGARQYLRYGFPGRGAERHVFVAGVQRSGTNMLMEVLERSVQTVVLHESDPRAFDDYLMRELSVIRELASRSSAPCFVVKALCESQRARELMDALAPAKTIWVFRHYHDVVNSMLRSFREHAVVVHRIARDRDAADWRGRGMSDETHAVVRRLARPELTNASAAAVMWYLRNAFYFDMEFSSEPRITLGCYEALVTRPAEEFKRIFEFLDLSYSSDLTAHVRASSVSKRPPPQLDPEVEDLCENMLGRLRQAHQAQCASRASAC